MEDRIRLHHRSGGLYMQKLIHDLFLKHFSSDTLHALTDSAILSMKPGKIAFTTDSYVVDPLFFPGGDIGKLAVCGTVNDLSVSGAVPLYISSSFILEEGFPLQDLEKIIISMAEAAKEASG